MFFDVRTLLRRRKAKGFSMIEMLTVIFLIAFMISFLAYAMLKYMRGAKEKATHAQLQRIGLAMAAYYADFHEYPPDTGYGLNPANGKVGTTVMYDPGSLYRYLATTLHWQKQTSTGGTIDMGYFGPYLKFEPWELKAYNDANYGDSFMIVDTWGTELGYIGSPKRKIHNLDGVDLFSCGPDRETASDKAGDNPLRPPRPPVVVPVFPAGFNFPNRAYSGPPSPDDTSAMGHAVLNGCLTQYIKDKSQIANKDSRQNLSLDDINNWDPE